MFENGIVTVKNCLPLRDESASIQLKLHKGSPPALVIFRILLGGVDVLLPSGREARQLKNFLVLGCPEIRGFSISNSILQAFPGLGLQDRDGNFLSYTVQRSLDKYFRSTSTNKGFFEVILNEVSRSLVAAGQGNNLSAFVYIYRAIEHMSYALPFFHARHSSNYLKAFNDLRSLISQGDGELKFCEKFIAHIYDGDVVAATYKFEMTFSDPYSEKIMKYLKSVHSKHCVVTPTHVEVDFLKAFGFVVDVRNKFFHHLSGSNQSASSRQIQDADEFFKPINQVAISLVALILGKMIAAEI
ncbi:hypothetical protein [Stenotrophomonas sp. ZAC14A_NAIMI4_1]|uniref:hypothetical protein n=1 Tax=Stenotrophomonas sp. ZAC14A_NAIMI4_1 TaxID=2072412 RepID=UPI00131F1BAC|nr:hypothetical protein [Stenotrophomonas sp. ZAC14A_NAIMI4_1]